MRMIFSDFPHSNLPSNNASDVLWMRKRCANWLLALLEYDLQCTDNFFNCAAWTVGGMEYIKTLIQTRLPVPLGRSRESVAARRDLKELKNVNHKRIDRILENLCDENPILQEPVRDLMRACLTEWLNSCPEKAVSIFPRGFASLFNLDEQALNFCSFVWGVGNYRAMEHYFEDELELYLNSNFPMLAKMLGISLSRLRQMIAFLKELGILEDVHCGLRLADSIAESMGVGSMHELRNFFCKNVPSTDVPLEQFRIQEDEKKHVLKLMGRQSREPAHLLLYGAPGSGKTSFASRIAKELGVRAWAVSCRDSDSVRDRRVSLMACINLSLVHPGSIIVIDEAERLLDTDVMDTDNGSSKAWLNSLLERKGLRAIWITNKIMHIDQAVRRRFSFSIYFDDPGKSESLYMWENVAKKLHAVKFFPHETMERFAAQYPVPVAIMENAVRQAKSISGKKDFCGCVERILKSYLALKGNGYWQDTPMRANADYDPGLVCATIPPESLVKRIGKLREKISAGDARGMGNVLFYGPPGTGKTALAKYLAQQLDCDCLAKRASDLISPYVGQTEQNIAMAFHEASKSNSILLIDEVDSFIFNRENATRSWEQTMVNEFLTSLENFNGICICTTNFRKIIDSAAMRRFPFKVEFAYAGASQLRGLYTAILAPLCSEEPDESVLELVARQKHLTPGDFRSVRSQLWLEDNVTHEQISQCLLREQLLKLEKESKKVGFDI